MVPAVLSQLYIYPIKSAAGICLSVAKVEKRGLQYDRRWMVTDLTGKLLTQAKFPRMALIQVQIGANDLIIKAPDMETITVPLELDSRLRAPVRVWDDTCEATPVGATADEWFSQFLGTSCQLVYMPFDSVRPVNPQHGIRAELSFADAYPFLLISEASVRDLNTRLERPVWVNRFRPNLIVTGCDAFAEDNWHSIRIGSVKFAVVEPCSRCSVITVEQAKGIRGDEPLRTLATYRRINGQILFGQYLIHRELGSLHVGDKVELLEKQASLSSSSH